MDESTKQATRLWTLAQPSVSAFVASVVRDFKDRDDVLQEVAVAVIESFGTFDQSKPFNAWAIGIARNQIGLYLRKRKRDRHVFDEVTIASLQDAFARFEHPAMDHLSDCMREIEGRAKTICDLRYQQDLKPAAIAERIGMNSNAVAKALQRVRESLRHCIELKLAAEGD